MEDDSPFSNESTQGVVGMTIGSVFSAEAIRAAAEHGQAAITGAVARCWDGDFTVEVGAVEQLNLAELPAEWFAPGLVLAIPIRPGGTALALLPAAGGLLPSWCQQPDAAGQEKLVTLAAELGAVLFSPAAPPAGSQAVYVTELAAIAVGAQLDTTSHRLAVRIIRGPNVGDLSLVWPANVEPSAVMSTSSVRQHPGTVAGKAPASGPSVSSSGVAAGPRNPHPPSDDLEEGLRRLPAYSRSLLKIRVPVAVSLAEAKQPLQTILDLGPGSIIHFSKPCDETLTLEVAGQKFAVGETVKVGDKFGLWITSMIMPEERFWILGTRRPLERAK